MSCLLAVCLAIGVTSNIYEELEPSYSYQVKAGNAKYIWASYEDQTMRILGQGVSGADIYAVGAGAVHTIENFSVFGEIGYAFIEATDNEVIRNEIVYTELVRNHGVRTVPAGDPERDDNARTSYSISNGFIGRIGVGYQYKSIRLTMAYRVLTTKERIELWDVDKRAAGKGYWQETNARDLAAFELGIWYEF